MEIKDENWGIFYNYFRILYISMILYVRNVQDSVELLKIIFLYLAKCQRFD